MADMPEPPQGQDGGRPRRLLPGVSIILIGIIGIALIILMCVAVAALGYWGSS
jgi:hypothetical protein